jgi:hypothetical protein
MQEIRLKTKKSQVEMGSLVTAPDRRRKQQENKCNAGWERRGGIKRS